MLSDVCFGIFVMYSILNRQQRGTPIEVATETSLNNDLLCPFPLGVRSFFFSCRSKRRGAFQSGPTFSEKSNAGD